MRLASARVCCGFPNPADDHLEGEFDLNELLIKTPSATFLVKGSGVSMKDFNIWDGDLLIVDCAVEPKDGHIVVACLDKEFTCKQLSMQGGRVRLLAGNDDFAPIEISPEHDFSVWGVVRGKVTVFKV